uniref:Reverse transcriptase domain-containing protein n=1 Tax=Lepisosteus oculatus TaxID=7918 RepID=W5NKK8_LEPOC
VAIRERNEARKKMLQRPTRTSTAEFSRKRTLAKRLCRYRKREWQNRMLQETEELYRNKETRKVYQKITENKNGFQPRLAMCVDKEGNLIGDGRKILERWAEYFEELLNDAGEMDETGEEEEADEDTTERESCWNPPTVFEFKEAIRNMKNNKAPEEDAITAEMLKYDEEELADTSYKIISIILGEKWSITLVCPIHKKGSKLDCLNYCRISLLNVAYKVFPKVLASRLEAHAEQVLGHTQCGFRCNQSTTDHIFTIRCISEKCYEYNIDVHKLFIDNKRAYDSVDRAYLYQTLGQLGVAWQLIRLVKMTMTKVKVQNQESHEFQVRQGLRQGHALSSLLVNLVLESVKRNIDINKGGTLLNRGPYLAYVDDIDLLGRNIWTLKENFIQLEEALTRTGLTINMAKIKYMVM